MAGEVNYAGSIATGATTGASLGGPYGALIGAGAGLALSGIEYFQNKKQQARDEAMRPKWETPAEVGQGLTLANQQALQGLPEEQKQQYLQNLQRTASYSLGQQSSRKGGLAGLASLNENLFQGYGNMLAQDSAARQANTNKIYGQLQNVADYKGLGFQINQSNPYYENVARTSANRGTFYQNLNKTAQLGLYGLGSMGGMGGSTAGNSSAVQATTSVPTSLNQPASSFLNNTGNSYQNPNLFPQQGNTYGQDVGTYMNPNTANMFKQQGYSYKF